MLCVHVVLLSGAFFFFNDTATTEIYTLSLHDALPIFAALQAGARDARRRRLRGPVEELSLAARDRPLHGNAGRGGGPGESPWVVLRQLAVPDGGRGDRDRTAVAAVPRRAAVLRSGDRDDGRDLAPQALAWGRSFERDFPADVAAFRVLFPLHPHVPRRQVLHGAGQVGLACRGAQASRHRDGHRVRPGVEVRRASP